MLSSNAPLNQSAGELESKDHNKCKDQNKKIVIKFQIRSWRLPNDIPQGLLIDRQRTYVFVLQLLSCVGFCELAAAGFNHVPVDKVVRHNHH